MASDPGPNDPGNSFVALRAWVVTTIPTTPLGLTTQRVIKSPISLSSIPDTIWQINPTVANTNVRVS